MSEKVVKIAVDAMGGDYAPGEIVKGAIQAAREQGVEVVLVGSEELLKKALTQTLSLQGRGQGEGENVGIVNANEVIKEGESPVAALRLKPDASILVSTRMVKEGKADAVVSMGYTGAVMVAAIEILGKLEGIKRPSAGGLLCRFAPNTLVFDMGANADCKPRDLLVFAVIGSVVCRKILNVSNPTVALLSNGAEEGKGNLLVKKAYPLFKQSHLNFIGNVEGNDIPFARANVIVCDGFTGNILLKFCEGLGEALVERLKITLDRQLPREQIESITNNLFALTHTAEEGGPILGIDGVVVIGHGRSKAPQVANAINMAKISVESNLVEELKTELGRELK
ncbi:MAG: phosphate--acyl-ACP acyltransferase [Chloroflexi bacterium CG_4_9_14_3_um_filter_45_9]|nr:MAG: phosphate--acyl-ACP acyltransferase [Chloroflexi bacterium CG_4_9_14_3_um_filter_45_9]